MENTNKCPCCSKHCDRNNLQCGKGEAYFNGELTPSHESLDRKHHCCHGKKQHEHCREGRSHKHHPKFPAGSLADLMARCAHQLFHSENEDIFTVLSAEEIASLKQILNKLLAR